MHPVRFLPGVESDLDAAVNWFERGGEPGAADRFLGEFRATVDRVAQMGHVLRKSRGEFRHIKFPRFSYLLFYREESGGFIVALVINAVRNPAVIRALLDARR